MTLFIELILIVAGITGLYFAARVGEARSSQLMLASWLQLIFGVVAVGVDYWQIDFLIWPFR
ncbi:MAG: hypothetical protein KGI97_06555 [Alphaproteobacteria bacterium]|nr:hypothetical protein [Alphaproteobacteria bacterium]